MLYSESRFSCKKGFYTLTLILVMILFVVCTPENRHKDLTSEAFLEFKEPLFIINADDVRHLLIDKCNSSSNHKFSDRQLHHYYKNGGRMMWVNKHGVKNSAYTLLSHLKEYVPASGLNTDAFYISEIEDGLKRMENLDFDDDSNTIDNVLARLEYYLMKAYVRYSMGQRFGFINPNYVFNHMDSIMSNDSTRRFKGYRLLYALQSERPDSNYINHIIAKIEQDSVAEHLMEIQPKDVLYARLRGKLDNATGSYRKLILANMERCRWRHAGSNNSESRKVVVNIPAFHLYAYKDKKCVIDMKAGCGATKTKTPMLYSMIERIELNPQWHIPMSIITKDIVRHIGDSTYFHRNNYYIADRKTGERINPMHVSASMLRSGNYRVSQEGGAGNSLGRIIFRFKNSMSIYIHDTNSRGFFSRDVRAVSHGCVRVENPFGLAVYALGEDTDEWTLDKIRISMDIPPVTEKGKQYVDSNPDEQHRLISNKSITPPIPVYIMYFTLFPDANGEIRSYPDIYGYDAVILKEMTTYI